MNLTLFELEKYKKELIFMENNYRAKKKIHDACWVKKKIQWVNEQIKFLKKKEED